ncbi:hypothetical protein [Streptomyces sp. NPDC006638]|uniref:hypothetical protein n=1 Tax=Streptomyces sp. NPDC006638 TaxID=3157183 RepID=UPI0033B59468
MSQHHVQIRTDGNHGQVFIDGHDISTATTGLSFSADIGELPTLRLDLRLIDITELSSTETQVLLGHGVAEALKVLGWTPPEGQA